MLKWVILAMIYAGAALMIYNISCYARYSRFIRNIKGWNKRDSSLNLPIILLIGFLAGYILIGLFGNPNIVMAGVLFGGSIFVYIMYRFLNDITVRILQNEELENKLKVAEESNRAKAGFLATVSHEMRTPMNVILGLDELALKDPDLKPETRDSLEKIAQNGKQLLGLINGVLAINDIDSGSMEIRNENFSLSEAMEQVNVIVRTLCGKKDLTYEYELHEGAAGVYSGDETQIKQALLKVLDNAVKFTNSPGTVRLDVKADAEVGSMKTITFTISDTGIGIDPDFIPRMFDVFSQQDESFTREYSGSGLGLAVVKKSVDLMGGTINVVSEQGKGSVFTITLPLEYMDQDGEAEEEEADLDGRKVLVVEDILENAEIIMDLLELEGVESEHAENGQIAVDMFEQNPDGYYDAVLMDLRMPVMDGLEASRRIRAMDRPDAKIIPIIAVTANAFDSDVKATMDAGMNAHLAKPADSELLYDTLRKQIAKAEKQKQKG